MTQIIKITLPTPFKVGPVNVYVIKGNRLTLVDTGPLTDETWQTLNDELKRNGIQLSDLDQVFLTHHHVDHVGLLDRILSAKKIPVYGHAAGIPYFQRDTRFISEREEFIGKLYAFHGVPVELLEQMKKVYHYYLQFTTKISLDQTLQEGDLLPGETGWRIIETPGHAPDHISLYHQESRVLIGGDHLIKNISSNAFIEPGYGTIDRPRSLVVYRNALLKLLSLPLDRVYAGHGEEIYDAHDLIKERIKKQDERAEGLLPLIEQGLNAFEMSKTLFPHLYLKELPLTMSEVVGHLDLLVEQGKIKIVRNGDRFVIHLSEGGFQPSMEKI